MVCETKSGSTRASHGRPLGGDCTRTGRSASEDGASSIRGPELSHSPEFSRSAEEQDLVARLRAGDADAVGPYIELHRRGLLSHIERNLGAGVRAKVEPEDVLQEVSLTAFTALPRYDLADRHPLNWLYQIAHRRIVGAYRRFCSSQKRASHREAPLYAANGRVSAEWLADDNQSPEQHLLRQELLEQVGRLWKNLSEDQRVTLRMRYVEGKPFKEIGEALGKTDCAVRVLLCRTLDRLQAQLEAAD